MQMAVCSHRFQMSQETGNHRPRNVRLLGGGGWWNQFSTNLSLKIRLTVTNNIHLLFPVKIALNFLLDSDVLCCQDCSLNPNPARPEDRDTWAMMSCHRLHFKHSPVHLPSWCCLSAARPASRGHFVWLSACTPPCPSAGSAGCDTDRGRSIVLGAEQSVVKKSCCDVLGSSQTTPVLNEGLCWSILNVDSVGLDTIPEGLLLFWFNFACLLWLSRKSCWTA